MIRSPLNYTGGKYKLLPQLLPHFPAHITTFVDIFCGGCNVGLNVSAEHVIYNDVNPYLVEMYRVFKRLDKEVIVSWIDRLITDYGLSRTSVYGYDFYGCESAKGVATINKEPFLRLREDFNHRIPHDDFYYVMLYVLIVYAFNNQIRFNQQGEFNLPVGKRDFNRSMARKLSQFIDCIQGQNCEFRCEDFRELPIDDLGSTDFVYADPPYLITCATYNEQGGWDEQSERDLLALLDTLSERGVRFGLSNVLRSKGKENEILLDWLEKHRATYRALSLNYSYANSNYQIKDKVSPTEEVLIVNY